jgi:hypothetical protein
MQCCTKKPTQKKIAHCGIENGGWELSGSLMGLLKCEWVVSEMEQRRLGVVSERGVFQMKIKWIKYR